MRVEETCRRARVPLIWKPFLLGPVFVAQGLETSPFVTNPVKGAYMWRDMERVCADQGLEFRKPGVFPRGSLLAARIVAARPDAPWTGDFIRAVYRANFAEDRDIKDDAVIAGILQRVGRDADAVIAAALSPEGKSRLRTLTEEAQARGVFGAPSMIVGGEMFWGHDRLDRAIAWAES